MAVYQAQCWLVPLAQLSLRWDLVPEQSGSEAFLTGVLSLLLPYPSCRALITICLRVTLQSSFSKLKLGSQDAIPLTGPKVPARFKSELVTVGFLTGNRQQSRELSFLNISGYFRVRYMSC